MNSRRISLADDDDDDDSESSPILSTLNSSSALILIHDDDEDNDDSPVDEEADEEHSPFLGITRPWVQPLSPSTVFLYLFSPYLKLGAILLPNAELPLKFSLPALFLFAVLAAFARQIWYMLSRYLRKGNLEDVLVDVFPKSIRPTVRSIVRLSTAILRLFLAMTYLREASRTLLSSLPSDIYISNWALTLVLGLLLYPLVIAQSLGSKRVVYSSWGSIVTYLLWFFCVIYAYVHGSLGVNPSWLRMGTLWQGITTIAFTFTSSSTLTLYASLKAGTHTATSAASIGKTPHSRSFRTLSIISVALAVCLTLPLLVFAASPNKPLVQDINTDSPSYRLGPFIQALSAITLLLGIPSIIITTPPLPIPERIRHTTTIPISKTLLFGTVLGLSLVHEIANVESDVVIVCALMGTYFLPALVHITTHFFKRPLSIIMPTLGGSATVTPTTPNFASSLPPLPPSSSSNPVPPTSTTGGGSSWPSSLWTPSPFPSNSNETPSSANDPLLQRKELMLQRAQFARRVIWDVGVWVLLLPVGGGGVVWALGRVFGRW